MKKRRSGKISKFGLVALGGVAVLLGLFFAWRQSTAPVGGPSFSQLPAGEQEKRREDLRKLESEVGDIAQKAKAKQKAPFTLTVTEEHLNTLLQDRLRTEKAPIRDLRAALSPNQITLQGTVDYKGFSAPATMTGQLQVQNGQVTFRADSLNVQGLPVGGFKDKIESEINKQLARGITEAPVTLESIEIAQGQMTLRGVTD
jgi:hypothetical protein